MDRAGGQLFRRAKLWLHAIPAKVLAAAVEGLLVGPGLGLTDRNGHAAVESGEETCSSSRWRRWRGDGHRAGLA
jgi:Family of unknown function (DUF5990)